MAEYGIYLSIGTIVSIVLASGGIVWKFSRVEKENRDWTEALIDNLRRDMIELERGSAGKAEELRQETGEVGHALRSKIHEVETWNRDTFVRKDSFELVISRIEKSIEKSTDKLEAKIDRAVERLQNGNPVA